METSSLGTVKTLHDTWLAFSSNGPRPCHCFSFFSFRRIKRIWRIDVRGSIPYSRVEIKKIEITAFLQMIVNHLRTSNLLRSRAKRNEMMTSANGIISSSVQSRKLVRKEREKETCDNSISHPSCVYFHMLLKPLSFCWIHLLEKHNYHGNWFSFSRSFLDDTSCFFI